MIDNCVKYMLTIADDVQLVLKMMTNWLEQMQRKILKLMKTFLQNTWVQMDANVLECLQMM